MTEENKQEKTDWWRPALDSYKPANYRNLIEAALWPALVTLLVLGIAQGGVLAADFALRWPDEVEKLATQWEKSFPKVAISNGIASSDATRPVTGEIDMWDKPFLVAVDTTGATHDIDPAWTQGLLITTSEIVIRQAARGRKPVDQRKPLLDLNNWLGDITLDAEGIRQLGAKLRSYYIGNMFTQWIINFALIKAVHMFMGTIIMLIAVGLTHRRVRYSKLVKLGFYALIPATTVELFFLSASSVLPESARQILFFIYVAIYVAYLVMAILNLDKPEEVSIEAT